MAVIHRSLSIVRHIDFFLWLQQDVRHFLQHDVLVAAWGDFAKGRVSYDLSSSIPGVRTQKVIDGENDIGPLVGALYARWVGLGQQWYALNHDGLLALAAEQGIPWSGLGAFASMKTVVVHGIHDKRSKDDCLYIFFEQAPDADLDPRVLCLLLPHIDAALRRVECLPANEPVLPETTAPLAMDVTEREREIMKWVSLGKTNDEIGMILSISPNTVKNHLKKIFQKLDVSSRAQAVAKFQLRQSGN